MILLLLMLRRFYVVFIYLGKREKGNYKRERERERERQTQREKYAHVEKRMDKKD